MIIQVRDNLYLGDHNGPIDDEFSAILAVMCDTAPYDVPGCHYLKIHTPDGPGFKKEHVEIGVNFLQQTHGKMGLKTLVHCWSGRSRSVAVLSAYIASESADVHLLRDVMESLRSERDGRRKDNVSLRPSAREVILAAEEYIYSLQNQSKYEVYH